MLFDDVDAEGVEAGPEAADRALFHCIATRSEVNDLPVDEAWGILADRYPTFPTLLPLFDLALAQGAQ